VNSRPAILKQRMEDYRYHLSTAARLSFDPEHQKMLRRLFTASHERVWEINGKDGPVVEVELIEGRLAAVNVIQTTPGWVATVFTAGRQLSEVIEATKAHGQPLTIVVRD
jgi:hypothetical protein